MDVEQFLSHFPERTQKLSQLMRKEIKKCFPDIKEKVALGWKLIGYHYPYPKKDRYVFFIIPLEDGIKLGFEWGAMLADPDEELTGSGSQVRYLEFKTQQSIRTGTFKSFLIEAVEMHEK